ncbi:microtubule organization protein AKNA [Coregonus clupeaformis]|uniref:microtubule organization protein AKNA n=1 Tax=Coregonus clupeaformis TaxID=59861 RepID=UPI001E1C74A4|nr:microtubule organization protein AKNA [Coregonus clupeaformis]XP_041752631.2 microtubule organization protein AKNA [Coregonus clupeaformis]
MEGDPQDQEEDSEAQRRASSPQSSVLWEKCIRQSIFVDLSENESLHFSDLEGSFTVHLSQAESAGSGNSIHLSENVELSVSDSGESSTESSSCVSGQSERVVEGKTKSSVKRVSAQRPNTEQEQTIWEDENPGDTSDEEQEDLPYDGDLGSQYINPTTNDSHKSKENCKIADVLSKDQAGALHSRHNVRDNFDLPAMVGEVNIIQGHMQIEVNTMNHVSITPPEGEGKGAFIDSTKPGAVPTCSSPVREAPHPDITQLLLRHFSQDELFCSGSLIEAETLPEVSLLESMDETVLSRGPLRSSTGRPNNNNSGAAPRRSSAGGASSESERSQSLQEEDEGKSVQMSPRKNLEEKNGKRSGDSPTASEGKNTQSADESYNSDVNSPQNSDISNSKSEVPEQDSNGSNGSDLTKEEDENDEDEEEDQICGVPLVRTRSFSELKYGQGQVHYPLPDFSKVAPKVKIPKSTSVTVRPFSQSPTFLRAQSSPGMLGKSSALEVINRVMEDSIQPSERPYVFRDQDKQTETSPGLVHHLQAEYDKLLTKYAEAENLIDQMRLGTKNQAPSDLTLEFDCGDQQGLPGPGGSHFGSTLFPNAPSPSGQFIEDPNQQNHSKQPSTSPTQTDQQSQSEGERMTRELRDIISQFLQKVDEFKTCLTTMSITIEEQEMVFKSMMDSQDQLERRYISKKEEHRTLEMQNYLGLARNTGQFDPERQVEGEIFRIGMHLEDIKELIDRNVCEQQLSPPHSSSTLLSMCGGPSLPGLLTPSLPPPLHEGLTLQVPGPCFSTGGYETVEREEKEYEEEASEVPGHDGLDQSCDSLLNSTGHSSVSLRLSQDSLETLDITNTEEEEEEEEGEERSSTCSGLFEGIAHDRVLEYLALQNPGLRDRLWTPESLQQSPLSPDCDLGGSASLAGEVSCSYDLKTQSQSITDHTLTTSQRIVSPETDSGFGSSDLSLPATGLSQPKLHTERPQFQPDGNSSPISMSDSEGSSANLQTTMHHPVQLGERRPNPQINVHSAGLTGKRTPSLQSTVHLTGDIGERRPSLQTPAQLQLCSAAVDHWVTSTSQSAPAGLHEGESHTPSQLSHHGPDRQLKTSHSITMDMPQRDCHSHTCSCHSEAIQSLQSEVCQLKRDLEEGLVKLPQLSQRMDYLTSRCRQNRDRRPKTRSRTHHKPAGSRQSLTNTNSKIEDWISSDMDPSKSKGTDSVESDRSGIMLPFHRTPLGGRRGSSKPYSCSDGPGKPQSKQHLNTASEENRSLETSNLTHPSPPALWHSYKNSSYRSPPPPGDMENVYSKGRYPLPSQPLQKLLLQVNYGSSCSLPAGFKVQEQQSVSHHRRRSTQSDSALLPSNVYFQRTFQPALSPPRTGGRASRHKASKDEDINRTLDRAIEAARSMKRTTDRMAKSLSADLAKVELYRKLHGLHPLTGSSNTGS